MKREPKSTAQLPKEHWEKSDNLDCDGTGKYSRTETSNPEELKEGVKGLESYAKGHKYNK